MKTVFIGMTIGTSTTSNYFDKISSKYLENNYQVVIITDGKKDELVDLEGSPIILTWPSSRPTGLKDALFLVKSILKYKPEIIIANFGSVNLMSLISYLLRVPKRFIWVHSISAANGKMSLINKLRKKIVYFCATELVANSNAMLDDLKVTYNIPASKIKVVTNAIHLVELGKVEKKNKIIYVGRLHKIKGVDTLIKAFSEVRSKYTGLTLEIIGVGDEESELKKLISELKLDSIVKFCGYMSQKDVIASLSEAKFSVVPSRYEAFGNVVIEAMIAKTAVIGSRVGGIPEIIRDQETGLLFECDNVSNLVEKMKFYLDNPNKITEYSENAYQLVKEKYEIEKVTLDFVKYTIEK